MSYTLRVYRVREAMVEYFPSGKIKNENKSNTDDLTTCANISKIVNLMARARANYTRTVLLESDKCLDHLNVSEALLSPCYILGIAITVVSYASMCFDLCYFKLIA